MLHRVRVSLATVGRLERITAIVLVLNNISKQYDGSTVLHPFTYTVPESHITVIIGPSGSGKSTILRIIAGLIASDTGNIEFNNTIITAENIEAVRRRFGYVIQEGGLFPHLTVEQNVTLMARYLGWDLDKMDTRTFELAQLVNFQDELFARYPTELSGGQRQRVSIMRSLMLDPEVLLLDEPLGALDPMMRFDLQSELKEIFQKLKKTVIFVTHDLAEAAFFADTIVLMKEGKIAQKGSLEQMINSPDDEFVSRFIRAQRSHLENSG